MSTPSQTASPQLIKQRQDSGLFDYLVEKMRGFGHTALCNVDYDEDFFAHKESSSSNISFIDRQGRETTTLIMGMVHRDSLISSKGGHNAGTMFNVGYH